MVSVAASSLPAIDNVLTSAIHGRRRVRTFLGRPEYELLNDLATLAMSGAIVPLIDTSYSLEEMPDAHRAFEAGGSQGKHVIQLTR